IKKSNSDGTKTGFTWKPVSDGANYPRPIIIYPSNVTCGNYKRTDILASNGDLAAQTRIKSCTAARGGPAIDPFKTSKTLRQFAPLVIRLFYKNGGCEDRVVPDPLIRTD